jgi:hypothetical protein
MIARNRFAKLLQRPGCRWMRGDVAGTMRRVPTSISSRHHDQEIAGDDGLGMIADKRPPVLRRGPQVAPSLRLGRPIGAHCTWRNIDTQLHRQLCCYTCLSPSRILLCHLHNKFADAFRKSWPTSLRLPFPKQLETLAMPANQRLGFDDDQRRRPEDLRETGGIVQSSWLDLPHRRPVAFAGTRLPRSGLWASGTGAGRKEARPRPDW